jgi:uncharacterized phage-associated protein
MNGFCETCRDTVSITIKEKINIKNIRGKDISYNAQIAYCDECNEEIFVSEIRDNNLKALDTAFRDHENLINVSEIESILERYNIGKRPLSLLLNWGELTLTRYLDGDIPTKQYSDTLKRILTDTKYMVEILEVGKENISDRAYKLCKESIEKIRTNTINGSEKVDSAVKYFILRCVEITPLALQKLLYYTQGFYKAFNGAYLFENDCEAWIHGPVYKNVYDKYKTHGFNPIEEDAHEYENFELSENEIEMLDSIIMNFGCYSGKVLEKMTHIETPWRDARKGLGESEPSNVIIKKEAIAGYFTEIKAKYNMLNYSDIKDYSVDLFKKLYN